MKILFEGERRNLAATIKRNSGSGAIALTTPQRRILDANKAVVAGFDWAAATFDSTNNKLYALFDTTAAGLSSLGTYFMQLRGTIGQDLYVFQITVQVKDLGP